jgi:hypothetical protein
MYEWGQDTRSNMKDAVKKDGQQCPQKSTLLRYWEIEEMFKCPVVGMCLTDSEQKQLLKKSRISVQKKNPFGIHERLVSCSSSENHLSRRIDNLLQRKFGKEATSLLAQGHQEFMIRWRAASETGDFLELFIRF